MSTRLKETGHRIIYPTLGLAGETGEVVELVKKSLRPGGSLSELDMALELGDVLWYIAALCDDLGLPMGTVADLNLKKLAERKKKGEIASHKAEPQADGAGV